MGAAMARVVLGTLLVWSATSARPALTGDDPTAYLKKQLVNVAIGLVLLVMVLATDHRWLRIVAPLASLASIIGLVLVLVMGTTVNGSRRSDERRVGNEGGSPSRIGGSRQH